MKKALVCLAFVWEIFSGTYVKAQVPSFADLAEQLLPVVINISTTPLDGDDENKDDTLGVISSNPQIQNYFTPQNPQHISLGSGFIIDESGYAVTNAHVIDKAKQIMVTLFDNQIVEAEIVGIDKMTDLALLKLKSDKPFVAAKLGDSDKTRVGDWVLAIGNPFGLGGSVTAGIVSAKSRDIDAGVYDNFIQTDASINQGSSGGPMFNLQGEVIGINSAIYSTNGGSMGIGFAAPINMAKFVLAELKEKGKVERGWLGIKIQLQDNNNNTVISSVVENSPAEKALLEAGDVILSLNGENVSNPRLFSRKIAEMPKGKEVVIELLRENKKITKTLIVESMPEIKTEHKIEKITDNDEISISVEELTKETALQHKIPDNIKGVIVTRVDPNSDAAEKGIKVGDVITEIDKLPIINETDVLNIAIQARRENNRSLLILINNNNIPHFASVKL